jgi:putative restriction endonuclease
MNEEEFCVLKAYLCKAKSQRWIQENIMGLDAPVRGGGYVAMKVLHKYGARKEHKGLLAGYEVTPTNILELLHAI